MGLLDGSLSDYNDTAAGLKGDNSYDQPVTSETVTTDAVNGSGPVDNNAPSAFSGLWNKVGDALVGFGLKRAQQLSDSAGAQQDAIAYPHEPAPALSPGGTPISSGRGGFAGTGVSNSTVVLIIGGVIAFAVAMHYMDK